MLFCAQLCAGVRMGGGEWGTHRPIRPGPPLRAETSILDPHLSPEKSSVGLGLAAGSQMPTSVDRTGLSVGTWQGEGAVPVTQVPLRLRGTSWGRCPAPTPTPGLSCAPSPILPNGACPCPPYLLPPGACLDPTPLFQGTLSVAFGRCDLGHHGRGPPPPPDLRRCCRLHTVLRPPTRTWAPSGPPPPTGAHRPWKPVISEG